MKQPDSLASWSAVAQWFMADHERSQRIPKATPEPSLGFTATMTQIMQEQADVIKHMTGKKNIFDISEKRRVTQTAGFGHSSFLAFEL